jgi:hypothetical protein
MPVALLAWALTRPLGMLDDPSQPAEQSRALFDEWLLGATLESSFGELGLDDGAAMVGIALTRVLLAHESALAAASTSGPRRLLESLLADGDVRDFLGVNRYRDVLWFNHERFEGLVGGLLTTALVGMNERSGAASDPSSVFDLAAALREAEKQSAYQVERLLRLLPA